MIQLKPQNFFWPQSNNQEPQNIAFDDYQIKQITEYIKEQMGVDNVVAYSDEQLNNQLLEEYTLTQQGLQQDCIIYLVQAQGFNVNLYLDGVNLNQMCQVQADNTCQEIIEQIFEGKDISRIELKNSLFQLIASDPFIQIENLNNKDRNLHLYVYSQPQQQQQYQQQSPQQLQQQQFGSQQQNSLSNSSIGDPKQLLDQLVVLSKMSLLIDQNGQFIVFKFHQPYQINGILFAKNGKARQINDNNYDYVKKHNTEIAQADEEGYSLLVKWQNNTYSSIKIKKIG